MAKQVDYNELKQGEIRAMNSLGDALSALMNVYKNMKYAESFSAQIDALEEGEAKIAAPYTKMLIMFAEALGKATEADPLFRDHMDKLARRQFVHEMFGSEE